ncbi:hypothetical protein ACLMJK_001215 [Lecanora helva]
MAIQDAMKALQSTDLPANNSTTSITQLPANILEAFIPGYSVISKFLLDSLGFDITLLVSVCFLVFGLVTSLNYAGKHAYRQFEEYCMSFIRIDSDDDIYEHIMEWLASQKISVNSRKLMARSGRENAWDMVDGDAAVQELDPNTLINFSNWDAKVPPRFQPSFGSHLFFHKGRFFQFKREEKQVMSSSGWGGHIMRDDENVVLTCIGRSTQPIKDLIKEARDHYLDKEKSSTVVRRPCPKEHRGRGRSVWMKVATRPSRPMHTVVLDHDQKNRVLTDINEYLHPSTPKWYANRGIPYRRGYLFHGPPGTGKSSLAWAIAGVFGLDIYCISLVDPTLTEEDLGMMFTSLPRRCVVLLEDIDAAGLNKRQELQEKEQSKDEDPASKMGAEITKAFKAVQKNDKDKQGITLSGLLNAIDGVASHEGRVLVMTTNFPDKLDEALIRPGRIDMKIPFTNATHSQIKELFVRMYSPDVPETSLMEKLTLGPVPFGNEKAAKSTASPSPLNDTFIRPKPVDTPPQTPNKAQTPAMTSMSPDSVESIAIRFADRVPEHSFTPAEIQGFLLTRKKEPKRALDEVDAWKESVLEARKKQEDAKAEVH